MVEVATGIARILKTEGIEWVSTFPVCRVNNALGQEKIPMIMMRDDRYAVALADAYSRMTAGNKIGVCTVQGGVNAAGLQVAYAGLAQAFEDGSPVLCITDGVPIGGSENSQFDVTTSLKSVSKWYGYIDHPSRVPEFMRRAFTMLRNGIKGPVVIAVPNPSAEYDENLDPYEPVKSYKFGPDPLDVQKALDMINESKKPLIYAGEGVIYADASKELLTFAESTNIPVATTLKAKGVFPENHPLSVGVRGDHTAKFIEESDLILAIGTSLSPGRFSHSIPNATKKKIIQCNLNELHVNRIFPTAHCVLGDAKFTLRALIDVNPNSAQKDSNSIRNQIDTERKKDTSKYRPAMESSETPINPYRVYADMMQVLDPNNSFVTHDSGNTRDQLSTIYETHISRGFLGWGNVSTLGFSLPAAMAAKLAYPERDCIAVSGEAGIGYMLGNLEVPVREKIGITVVHISNGGFSGYGPGFWGEGHDPYTHTVLGYNEIDMSKMIGEIGIHTERVSDPSEIVPALNRALDANKKGIPSYVEFICSQYPVYGGWISGSHGE